MFLSFSANVHFFFLVALYSLFLFSCLSCFVFVSVKPELGKKEMWKLLTKFVNVYTCIYLLKKKIKVKIYGGNVSSQVNHYQYLFSSILNVQVLFLITWRTEAETCQSLSDCSMSAKCCKNSYGDVLPPVEGRICNS